MTDNTTRRHVTMVAAIVAAFSVLSPLCMAAQDSVPPPPQTPLVTASDWWTLGAFVAGTALAAPFDAHMAQQFQRPSVHRNRTLDHTASGIRTLGDPGALILSVGAYTAGRITHHPTLADVGLHATEAAVVSGIATGVIKQLVGRARPYVVSNYDATVFKPLRWESGYSSFPSGHTTAAFATAAAVSAELSRSDFARTHRVVVRVVTPMLYGTASLVGLSRMYHNAHWGSDVVAGAGLGTLAGHMVVRMQHNGAPSHVERWLLPSRVAPSVDGAVVAWSVPFR